MKLIVSILALFASFSIHAHAYYFGFAEMSYNQDNQNYEVTLVLSTHDVEEYFQSKSLNIKELEDHIGDANKLAEMSKVLLSGFKVKAGTQTLQLSSIGYEVLPNGLTHFYFNSQKIPSSQNFDIEFDLMMEFLPEQQNKLTFLQDERSITTVFTQSNKSNILTLN
ncbi:MAG: hypothetical protein KJ941_01330 [Bacteroidetes bacterium]|nr:hypothetical protein [Bacteroidota bacterium]